MPLTLLVNDIQILLLMSIRILVIISFTPIVSSTHAPFFLRVVLAMIVAYIIKNTLGVNILSAPANLGIFIVLMAGEALIGAIIGFYIQMVFMFLNVISEFFSTQMGLRAVQVLNPLTGDESVVVSQFVSIIVMLVFIFSYSLQKVFYYGIAQSFLALNAESMFQAQEQSFFSFLFFGFSQLFERSFIIALPIFIALLIVNIALGLFGKVAPQMNLLVLGLPLQIAIGLILLFLFLPTIVGVIESSLDNMFDMITGLIKRMRG